MKRNILILFISITALTFSQSRLKLPSIIGSNMVLQQQSEIRLWGSGMPNSVIAVNCSWGENVNANVNENSKWICTISTPVAGGPFTIQISNGNESIELTNILIGEVWLCSGQSNMEMPLMGWPPNDLIGHSEETIKNSNNNKIRLFTVVKDVAVSPREDCVGEWFESNPKTSSTFSATAYFFGKKLFDELNVPIGLIHSSWGGTPAESWTSKEYIQQFPEFDSTLEKIANSKPVYKELNEWLNSFPIVDLNKSNKENIMEGLEFNDENCKNIKYDDSNWDKMNLPILWESTKLGTFDGAIWFRKMIELPESWINKKLKVELGPIDDFDITYVNGVQVGAIEEDGNYQTKRKYDIPSEINIYSKLLVAVRVLDTRGGGGIYGESEELKLVNIDTKEELNIAGEWNYLPVAEFKGNVFYVFGDDVEKIKTHPKPPIDLSAYTPTMLYNAMISPIILFGIKGVIWYQGEANTGNAFQYESLFPTMITNWRNDFENYFPFYYVQIAPYDYGKETKSEFLRDAQRKTLNLDKTGMVVTLDIGDTTNIHPSNKKDVGERLALWALNKDYGKNIVYSGPSYKSYKIIKGSIELDFNFAENGLEIRDGKSQFLIAGPDKKFVTANAKVKDNKVIVWCEKINNPMAVRYAWSNNSVATLFNKDGFPASSFRTDCW